MSATFANSTVLSTWVKQLPSLVKVSPCFAPWEATYSWPFRMICAPNGGCPGTA